MTTETIRSDRKVSTMLHGGRAPGEVLPGARKAPTDRPVRTCVPKSKPRSLKASVLGVLALMALTACSEVEGLAALQDGLTAEAPTRLVLPPEFTPTPTAQATEAARFIDDQISIEPVATISWAGEAARSPDGVLSDQGPWLLYCDQDAELALINLDGSKRYRPGRPCLHPDWIAGAAGFGVTTGGLVQLPTGDSVRPFYGDPPTMGWSPDDRYFPIINSGMIGDQVQLFVYDLEKDRVRQLATDVGEYLPMGWSPEGRWLIYSQSFHRYSGEAPRGVVWAVSPDTGNRRRLYEISDGDFQQDFIKGWLSDASFIAARTVEFCDLALRHINVATGEVDKLYGIHQHAAADPSSDTILLFDPNAGPCVGDGPAHGLVRMTAAGDWTPQPVPLPAEWGDELAIRRIEWQASLGQFALWIEPDIRGGPIPWTRLVSMTPDGRIQLEFLIDDLQDAAFDGFFPSPDGQLIVVGSSRPASGRLYDSHGELVSEITSGTPLHVQWLPDSSAFFIVPRETLQLYRAAAAKSWSAIMVDTSVHGDFGLRLVEPPQRPYYAVCEGQHVTRLYLGDEVVVSDEPPLASRLRRWPSLATGSQVDALFPGERAWIRSGPVCLDGLLWWQLRTIPEGLTGWAAEGDATGAWLLPVDEFSPPGAEPRSTTLPRATRPVPTATVTPLPPLWLTPTPFWRSPTPAPPMTCTPTCPSC